MLLKPGHTGPVDFKAGTILLIDKPLEWTSFDVVNKVRYQIKRVCGKLKVGHAGTLDPLASGLLILCTGKMTKQIEGLQGMDKTYTGTIRLGASTPSYDLETEADQHYPTEHISEDMIHQAAKDFTGLIEQYPPIFSAVKKKGVKAYEAARKGEDIKLDPRTVNIKRFDITAINGLDIDFEVECSKGTYIRSLAHDFGKALNSGAHLAGLRRTAIGEYQIEEAWALTDLVDFINLQPPLKA